jgi:hypothetical protein
MGREGQLSKIPTAVIRRDQTSMPTQVAAPAVAQASKTPSSLLAIEDEPVPILIVDPPLPGPLSQGRVFIQYRTENLRVLPVFGQGAMQVSPRLGHVHITVDDAPWHFIDSSGETLVVVGLRPGDHEIRIDLANPLHEVIATHVVRFIVPDTMDHKTPSETSSFPHRKS